MTSSEELAGGASIQRARAPGAPRPARAAGELLATLDAEADEGPQEGA